MKPRPRLTGLAFLASVNLSIISTASAQSTQLTLATPPPVPADGSPTVAITFPDNSSLSARSQGGHFPLVAAAASQTVNIQLQFALTAAAGNLIVQSLDGGSVPDSQINSSVAADGTASIQFQTGSAPGLYRVWLNQGGNISILQFWVTDPQNPGSAPPALQPN